VLVRLRPDDLAVLDQWIVAQPDEKTRPEAIRYALKNWLAIQGVISISDRQERLR
jgi:hypothetical protein